MTPSAPQRATATATPKPEPKTHGRRPAWVTYVILGVLALVVMPVGAAMGTIYLSKSTDRVASILPVTAKATSAADESGR